jgi:DNA sulfur modification protein DndD
MRLLNLTIQNFGVFHGRHDFDLTPVSDDLARVRNAENAMHPLVVISGQNGVGKSTLFQALTLALHGSLALGDQVSRQAYSDFILSRLHRRMGIGIPVMMDDAAVSLSFRYVQSGQPQRILVERRWRRSGEQVAETLKVFRDGKEPEVAAEDYQNWLNDLFPLGLAAVCFFDAEKLESLSNPEHYSELLGVTLRRLLGLDLVERLQNDLDRYLMLRGGGSKEGDKLREEKEQLEAALKELDTQLEELKEQSEKFLTEEKRLVESLATQERRLVAEGGSYAARRSAMQERLHTVERDIEELSTQLRDMCAELLPFALAPELCASLSDRLKIEASLGVAQSDEQLEQQLNELKSVLGAADLWKDIKISYHNRDRFADRLIRKLRRAARAKKTAKASVLHQLANPERERLQNWITQAQYAVPQQTLFIGERLRALQEELSRIEADLRRAPDESTLAPIHAEIMRLQTELEQLRQRQTELNEQIGATQFQRAEADRKLKRIGEKFAAAHARQRQTQLAERSRRALRSYHEALLRQRVAALEKALIKSFNAICRKEHLIEQVGISPELFTVELRGADGRALDLSAFSAGERQLFALALLWSLRQVSGRQLPLVIDTPLARLDDSHRTRLLHDFVPQASDQVVLLTTDAELDGRLLGQAEPWLARAYRLHFNAELQETVVTSLDKPLESGLALYRGEMLGAIGLDVHGGMGRTWTTDAKHAAEYGLVRQAVLPASARRLVLCNPENGELNWAGIEELQRITGNYDIVPALKAQRQLFDLWQDEWTYKLRQAGYASIATYNIEGPEEYVLDDYKLIPLILNNGASNHAGNGHQSEGKKRKKRV